MVSLKLDLKNRDGALMLREVITHGAKKAQAVLPGEVHLVGLQVGVGVRFSVRDGLAGIQRASKGREDQTDKVGWWL